MLILKQIQKSINSVILLIFFIILILIECH